MLKLSSKNPSTTCYLSPCTGLGDGGVEFGACRPVVVPGPFGPLLPGKSRLAIDRLGAGEALERVEKVAIARSRNLNKCSGHASAPSTAFDKRAGGKAPQRLATQLYVFNEDIGWKHRRVVILALEAMPRPFEREAEPGTLVTKAPTNDLAKSHYVELQLVYRLIKQLRRPVRPVRLSQAKPSSLQSRTRFC